jgi:hypothetical protein
MSRPATRVTRVALAAVSLTVGSTPPARLVTVARAAEICGVSGRTIRNWHRRSSIGAVDPATRIFLVDLAQLAAALRHSFGGWLPYGLQP